MCPSVNIFNVLVMFMCSALLNRKSKALSIQPVEAKLVKKENVGFGNLYRAGARHGGAQVQVKPWLSVSLHAHCRRGCRIFRSSSLNS